MGKEQLTIEVHSTTLRSIALHKGDIEGVKEIHNTDHPILITL